MYTKTVMNKSILKPAGIVLTTIVVLGVLSWVAFTPDGDLGGVTGIRADEGDIVVIQETEFDSIIDELVSSIEADDTTRINIIQGVVGTLRDIRQKE